MNVVLVGLDHHTASLSLRERVAGAACVGTFDTSDAAAHSELLVIATCNRFEVYAATRDVDVQACIDRLVHRFSECSGLSADALRSHLYISTGEAAARHLCEVAAGRRSMIAGETQVVGQLRRALDEARRSRTLGPMLHRLGNCALAASRRTRGRASRRAPAESVCSRAVDAAHSALADGDRQVAIVGAGETASELLQLLTAAGVSSKRIAICNRTTHRAAQLATKYCVRHIAWEGLLPLIEDACVTFFATSCSQPVVRFPEASLFPRSAGNERLWLDLGVPRNVDPQIGTIERMTVVDVDMLAPTAGEVQVAGEDDVEISHWVREFETWRRRRRIVPTLSRLQSDAELIRKRELQRLRQRLSLGDREFEIISAMSRRLVNQMLHRPLSTLAAHPDSEELTRSARQLFDLE